MHILFLSLPPGEEVSGLNTFFQSHRAMAMKVNCLPFSFVLSLTQVCSASPQYPKWPFGSPSKVQVCWMQAALSLPSGRSPRLRQSVPAPSCRGSGEVLRRVKCSCSDWFGVVVLRVVFFWDTTTSSLFFGLGKIFWLIYHGEIGVFVTEEGWDFLCCHLADIPHSDSIFKQIISRELYIQGKAFL